MKVLITGARSGIGYLTALTLAEKKYEVYLTCHTKKEALNVRKKLKDYKNIIVLKVDITDENDRKRVKELDVDYLICNAASCEGGSILEKDMDEVRENYEVNVFSNFRLIQMVLEDMVKKDRGRIIVISSQAANISIPFMSVYASTKASISLITKSLQKEIGLISKNVKVVLVEPGLYHTGFNQVFLNNKYDNGVYFRNIKNRLRKIENLLFNLLEKKELDSIVIQIVRSVIDKKPKKKYTAPFMQSKLIKLYSMFK